jgi:prophage regulatory protein
MPTSLSTHERFLRWPQVRDRVPLSKSTIHRKVKSGEFPQPRQLGKRSIGWVESEVTAWIAAQLASSESPAEVTR